MTTYSRRLHATVAAVCPIDGVSVGTPGDPATVRVDYRPEATAEQRAAADAAVVGFDWSEAAQAAWEADRVPERKQIREAAAQAVADNTSYLQIATPTTAEMRAQLGRLTQQMNRVIRRLVQID